MKRIVWSALVLASVLCASPAAAGYKVYTPMRIDLVNRYASAIVSTVRASLSTTENMQVTVTATATGSVASVYMRDGAGTAFSCYSNDPKFVAALGNTQGDSSISVYWDANGICTTVFVQQGSIYAPKQP